MHLPIFLPMHGTPSIVGTPPGEVSPVDAAASSTVDFAARPSGLAIEAPGLLAVAKAPSQFKLNSTVSVTCAKSSPWVKGGGCDRVAMRAACPSQSPARLAITTV